MPPGWESRRIDTAGEFTGGSRGRSATIATWQTSPGVRRRVVAPLRLKLTRRQIINRPVSSRRGRSVRRGHLSESARPQADVRLHRRDLHALVIPSLVQLACQNSPQRSSVRTLCSSTRTSGLPGALSRLPPAQAVYGAHKSPRRPHKSSNVRPCCTDERTSGLPRARSELTASFSRLPRAFSSLPRPQVV